MSSSWRARTPRFVGFILTASLASPAAAAWELPPRRATVFLNFDGAALKSGSNAALGESECVSEPVDFPAFAGEEAAKATIVQIVRDKLAPYAVRVVTEPPPPELPYAMVMFGGQGSIIGVSGSEFALGCATDCGNAQARDTGVVFTGINFEVDTHTYAFGALLSLGQIFGLDFIIAGEDHIMRSTVDINVDDKVWATDCTPLRETSEWPLCGEVHQEFCPEGQQNDHAELLAHFGADSPDVEPPQVELVAPADGAELPEGDVAVEAQVSDDHEGFGWKLVVYADDAVVLESPAFAGETTWTLAALSPGVYRVEVAAIDHDRNVGRDEATIYVGVPAPADTTGDSAEQPTGGTSSGEDTTEGTDEGSGTGSEQEEDVEGCACDSSSPSGGWVAALLGLCWLRRRRR